MVYCSSRPDDAERSRALLAAQGLEHLELRQVPLADLLDDPVAALGSAGKVGLVVLSRVYLRRGMKSPSLGYPRKKLLLGLSQAFRAPLIISNRHLSLSADGFAMHGRRADAVQYADSPGDCCAPSIQS